MSRNPSPSVTFALDDLEREAALLQDVRGMLHDQLSALEVPIAMRACIALVG